MNPNTPNTPISERFEHKKPNEEGVKVIQDTRDACKDLAVLLDRIVPESREKSLAITKLEEVSMWANKAIVFHPREED